MATISAHWYHFEQNFSQLATGMEWNNKYSLQPLTKTLKDFLLYGLCEFANEMIVHAPVATLTNLHADYGCFVGKDARIMSFKYRNMHGSDRQASLSAHVKFARPVIVPDKLLSLRQRDEETSPKDKEQLPSNAVQDLNIGSIYLCKPLSIGVHDRVIVHSLKRLTIHNNKEGTVISLDFNQHIQRFAVETDDECRILVGRMNLMRHPNQK